VRRHARTADDRGRLLAEVLENLPDLVLAVGPGGRTLEYVSPSVEKVLGLTAEQLARGWPAGWIEERVHPEDREAIARDYLRVADVSSDGPGALEAEFRFCTAGDCRDARAAAWRWVHARMWRVGLDSDAVSMLVLLRDVTAEKAALGHWVESESRYGDLLGALREAVLLFDPGSRRILDANPEALARYGRTLEEMRGLTLDDVEIPAPAAVEPVDRASTPSIGLAAPARLRHRRRDGSTFPVEMHAAATAYRGAPAVLAVVVDVSAREAAEWRLLRTTRFLYMLLAVNELVVRSDDRRALLEGVCRAAAEAGRFALAWIGETISGSHRVVRAAWAGDEALQVGLRTDFSLLDRGRCPPEAVDALRGGAAWVAPNPRQGPWVLGGAAEAEQRDVRGAAAFPLRVDGEMSGILVLVSRQDGDFADDETALLSQLSEDVSFGLAAIRREQVRREAETALARSAFRDALTGLPNRAELLRRLVALLERPAVSRRPLALLGIGVERFEEMLPVFGHAHTDLLLQALAGRIAEAAPAGSVLARTGDDVFLMLVPGIAGAVRATAHARALQEAVRRSTLQIAGCPLRVGFAIGIALHPEHGDDAATLLRRLEVAVVAARRRPDRIAVFDPAAEADPMQLSLMADLQAALEVGAVDLHYQPEIDLRTGRTTGAEALVRWSHPHRGPVRPDEFIGLAERTGLIGALTEHVLTMALGRCAEWARAGRDIRVSVNLSARDLFDPLLPDRVESLLRLNVLPPDRVVLELTETSVMEDREEAARVLGRLHDAGLRISIDDFGTGYSSLAYLSRLPVDQLKVDRAFVSRMTTEPRDHLVVGTIVQLARNLGLEVVAEGVEDSATREELLRIGCQLGQGFGIARPMPAAALLRWLDDGGARGSTGGGPGSKAQA
jgi:diguanylate cyclase (GGDEF)-like protein/PAS domain S-box-containing protein